MMPSWIGALLGNGFGADGGGFGGVATPPIAAPPATPKSRLEQLLLQLNGLNDQPDPTFNQLPSDDQHHLRQRGMLEMAAALSGAPMGQMGSAIAHGALVSDQEQQQAVDDFAQRRRQQLADQRANVGRQIEVERSLREEQRLTDSEQRSQHMQTELGKYADALTSGLDPNDPRVVEAHTLADVGDHAGLTQLGGKIHDEQQKRRERETIAAKYHLDPNDPHLDAIAEQMQLRDLHLGAYKPEKPPEPQRVVDDATGHYVFVDPRTGRKVADTGITAPSSDRPTAQDKETNADLGKATTAATADITRAHADWQKAQAAWVKNEGIDPVTGAVSPAPPPPQLDFESLVQQHYQQLQRARAAAKPAPKVNPLEGHAEGAPVSATGPGGGKAQQSKYTPDDVFSRLPKGFPPLPPAARQQMQAKLDQGLTPKQIADEIAASFRRAHGLPSAP